MRHVSPDDIHVYSIDECFMDVTPYIRNYNISAHELVLRMIREVLKETGITATAGRGTNMCLAKGKLIVQEMTEILTLDLVCKRVVTKKIGFYISYDRENLTVAQQGRTIRDSIYNIAKEGRRYTGVIGFRIVLPRSSGV